MQYTKKYNIYVAFFAYGMQYVCDPIARIPARMMAVVMRRSSTTTFLFNALFEKEKRSLFYRPALGTGTGLDNKTNFF